MRRIVGPDSAGRYVLRNSYQIATLRHMRPKHVTATELKNRLGTYLDRVSRGQTVIVTDRGRPVARIIPEGAAESESLLERLIAKGLVRRRPTPGQLPKRIRTRGKNASDVIVEERRR